jgi:fatty acid desaturase
MFTTEQYWQIVQSDIAFLMAFALLCFCVYTFGFSLVAAHYLVPYMITNYHLVLITFLQHTDVYMPHFDDSVGFVGLNDDTHDNLLTFFHRERFSGVELVARCTLHCGSLVWFFP